MELCSAICEPVAALPSGLGKDGVRGGSNITLPLWELAPRHSVEAGVSFISGIYLYLDRCDRIGG